jgi:hypothetical protein
VAPKLLVVLFTSLVVVALARAQPPADSAALAEQLGELLRANKLDSIATVEPDSSDRYVAALYFPSQLLLVSARYNAPVLLRERVLSRDYREVYLQLQGAGEPEQKLFVQDMGSDGLHLKPRPDQTLDVVYESVGTRMVFDGNWTKQGLTEQQYRTRYESIDQRYKRLLTALINQLKSDTLQN